MLIKLIKPYLKRIQCNDKFWENGRAVDAKKRDMVVSRVLRRRPNLVPRALFLGFEAREKRPGGEVGLGHAPVAI